MLAGFFQHVAERGPSEYAEGTGPEGEGRDGQDSNLSEFAAAHFSRFARRVFGTSTRDLHLQQSKFRTKRIHAAFSRCMLSRCSWSSVRWELPRRLCHSLP